MSHKLQQRQSGSQKQKHYSQLCSVCFVCASGHGDPVIQLDSVTCVSCVPPAPPAYICLHCFMVELQQPSNGSWQARDVHASTWAHPQLTGCSSLLLLLLLLFPLPYRLAPLPHLFPLPFCCRLHSAWREENNTLIYI